MRDLALGMAVCLIMGAAAGAQTPDAQMIAPIQKFIDSFNKGDIAGAAATHAAEADLVIIDEVSPFLWRGPRAFQQWSTDLDGDSKKRGVTDQMVKIGRPTRTEVSGDQAYVVVPAVFTFKEGAVAMRETAQMTFVLKKSAGGWLIHGWTWTGSKPTGTAKK
jgi:ketosteroid isomerase-like protein